MKRPSGKGQRLIILHAGSENGVDSQYRLGFQIKEEQHRLPRRNELRAFLGVVPEAVSQCTARLRYSA